MAESHLSRSNHLGKTLQMGNRLVSTSVSVFIMTAIFMAGGGVPGLSLRASAQSPMSPSQTPTTGDRATGREYGDEQSRKASLVKQGSQRAMAIPSTSERADILPFPGATTGLISINQTGNATGNDDSYNKAISEDADKVAFDSYASDLVSGIDNPADPTTHRLLYSQVFLHTISNGLAQTIQLSLQKDDTHKGGDQKSAFPTISGDGKWVSWVAHATNLVDNVGLTSGYGQVYLRDLANSITTIITKTTDGTPGNGSTDIFKPYDKDTGYPGYIYTPLTLSTDGSVLVYQSTATNLTSDVLPVPADPQNPITQIFAYDTRTHTNTLISKSSWGGDPRIAPRSTHASQATGDTWSFRPALPPLRPLN